MNRHTIDHAPLVIDVAGPALDAADRRRLQDPLVGAVIHFARNWKDRATLAMLNREIKAMRPDLLICVDQEGGRVQRFRTDGFTRLPPMRALGELWMKDAMRAVQAATACGLVLATELRACGVDFSFAPVLDLDHGCSGVIGDRSFHRDPRVVALLAQAVAHGMLQAGMACCGKHFPGHGFVKADSHVEIPVDRRSLKAILADDARPFEWLAGSLAAVMPAHVIYAKVDDLPAGFSPRWLQEILRGRLGFEGAIFSDDLNMEAARHLRGEQLGFADAALAALAAGCDMALLCNRSLGDGAVLDAFLRDVASARRDGRWQPSAASEARRQALLPRGPAPTWESLAQAPAYQRAVALVRTLVAAPGA
ncbi:beta-N-acetylhexosaminidase [Variovorax sp.]|uniref:beta-N-acetylhexosaminidase n=1 Tax=Variovorax sp. TaxID=1871043 RepID=UPI002D4EEB1F|nr:beta-N-acetylhexosaminidase [Variovorax sp.]HYP84760.1 beta-N-acetylhexosaminidase [Variovorax sp.]